MDCKITSNTHLLAFRANSKEHAIELAREYVRLTKYNPLPELFDEFEVESVTYKDGFYTPFFKIKYKDN
jgi:hypothetical protein